MQLFCNIVFPAAFCVLLLSSCLSGSEREVRHPEPERLPADDQVNHTVDLRGEPEDYFSDLFHPGQLQEIGALDIDSDTDISRQFYQSPKKIDMDDRGNIYLLHRRTNSVHVYDHKGDFLYKIGSGGRGPGEFQRINTFDFDAGYNTMYVLDFHKVEIFSRTDNNRFEPSGRIHTKLNRTYDLCVLGNWFYVSGYGMSSDDLDSLKAGKKSLRDIHYVSGPVKAFSLTGDTTFSFGYQYPSFTDDAIISGTLSESILDCNQYSETVIAQFRYFPFMFGYRPDGELKWTSRIDHLNGPKTTEFMENGGKPGMYYFTNEEPFRRFYWFRETGSRFAVIQLYNSRPKSQFAKSDDLTIDPYDYKTIIVDTRSGKLSFSESYGLIGMVKDNTVITIDRDTSVTQRTIRIHELR